MNHCQPGGTVLSSFFYKKLYFARRPGTAPVKFPPFRKFFLSQTPFQTVHLQKPAALNRLAVLTGLIAIGAVIALGLAGCRPKRMISLPPPSGLRHLRITGRYVQFTLKVIGKIRKICIIFNGSCLETEVPKQL
jgi:hypothetical protein